MMNPHHLVIVPKEPTQKMFEAYEKAYGVNHSFVEGWIAAWEWAPVELTTPATYVLMLEQKSEHIDRLLTKMERMEDAIQEAYVLLKSITGINDHNKWLEVQALIEKWKKK